MPPAPSEKPDAQGGVVTHALRSLISQIPTSQEKPTDEAIVRAQTLAKNAAMRAAALSGSLALPVGPLGLATVLPDLVAVWRIQQQLVADIAAVYGKTAVLTPETMVVCLFKHGGPTLTRKLLIQAGSYILVPRIATRTLQQLIEKIAVRLTQRMAAKSIARWIPVLGAVGVAVHAYYDTNHVATNAMELFSTDVRSSDAAIKMSAETPDPKTRRIRTRQKSGVNKPPARAPFAKSAVTKKKSAGVRRNPATSKIPKRGSR